MQHHLNASAVHVTDLGTIEHDPRAMGIKKRFQFLHEGSNFPCVKLLWQLHDDYGPTR
jgi:hypothetical protein